MREGLRYIVLSLEAATQGMLGFKRVLVLNYHVCCGVSVSLTECKPMWHSPSLPNDPEAVTPYPQTQPVGKEPNKK